MALLLGVESNGGLFIAADRLGGTFACTSSGPAFELLDGDAARVNGMTAAVCSPDDPSKVLCAVALRDKRLILWDLDTQRAQDGRCVAVRSARLLWSW